MLKSAVLGAGRELGRAGQTGESFHTVASPVPADSRHEWGQKDRLWCTVVARLP